MNRASSPAAPDRRGGRDGGWAVVLKRGRSTRGAVAARTHRFQLYDDLPGRRLRIPRVGMTTDAGVPMVPLLPGLHEVLLEHRAERPPRR